MGHSSVNKGGASHSDRMNEFSALGNSASKGTSFWDERKK
jgi:hypothetical protein